jgi:hypothetical protein
MSFVHGDSRFSAFGYHVTGTTGPSDHCPDLEMILHAIGSRRGIGLVSVATYRAGEKNMGRCGAPIVAVGLVAILACTGGPAEAGQLVVTSYSMPNGDGGAHGGGHNYWDLSYSHCVANNCTTDGLSGSYLSGGTGMLTDGIVATQPYYYYYANNLTPEYVGWLQSPTITFYFGSDVTINEVQLYVDNSHAAGVAAPSSVVLDGTDVVQNPASILATGPEEIDITSLDFTGDQITVQLNLSEQWVFMSEAKFFGATSVPEPATVALFTTGLFGLAGLELVQRRRRT